MDSRFFFKDLYSTRTHLHPLLYGQSFLSYRPFWDNCAKWPPNDIEHQQVKGTTYVSYNYCWDANFSSFCSMVSLFRVTGHFKISASNDPKVILNTTRSKVPHNVLLVSPKSQISVHFALWPAVFKLPATLRQVHLMNPALPWTLWVKWYLVSCNYPWIPNFNPFCCTVGLFRVTDHLRQVHRMTPNMFYHYPY